jgi:hypothetical protein
MRFSFTAETNKKRKLTLSGFITRLSNVRVNTRKGFSKADQHLLPNSLLKPNVDVEFVRKFCWLG